MVEKVRNTENKMNKAPKVVEGREVNVLSDQMIEITNLENKLHTFHITVINDVQKRMSHLIDDIMLEMHRRTFQLDAFGHFVKSHTNAVATPYYYPNRLRSYKSSTATATTNRSNENVDCKQKEYGAVRPALLVSPYVNSNQQLETGEFNINDKLQRELQQQQLQIAAKYHNDDDDDDDDDDNDDNAADDGDDRNSIMEKQKRTQTSATKASKYYLPKKNFMLRESYLTLLLEVDHMKTIYHIFHIIFLIFLINTITHDYFIEGSLTFGIDTVILAFGKFHYAFGFWLLGQLFTFSIYYALKFWAIVRSQLNTKPRLQHLWSLSCLWIYIASQLSFHAASCYVCSSWKLPFASALSLQMETVRLLMKMHAFVRTIAARIVKKADRKKMKDDDFNENDENSSINKDVKTTANNENMKTVKVASLFPNFGTYLYFLFAPTLLYRDSYPRTSRIRYRFAFARLMEIVAIVFLWSNIYKRHIYISFSDFGLAETTMSSFIVKLFGMFMPMTIIMLSGFYLILHAWPNFTGELLQFGDRMFYKDWWTASNYDEYYRNWNAIVHGWLYEYLYRDMYMYFCQGSKFLSSLIVFTVSAIYHEVIVTFTLQMFFPILYVCFGVFGVFLLFVTRLLPKNFGNIFLWFTLITGNGILATLYGIEHFARQNCHVENSNIDSLEALIRPYFLNCL